MSLPLLGLVSILLGISAVLEPTVLHLVAFLLLARAARTRVQEKVV